MTARGLAKNYLRYWNQDGTKTWRLAQNAPPSVQRIVRTMAPTITSDMAFEAFRIVSGGPALPRPTEALLAWLMAYPQVQAHCDAALAGKNPPRTLAAVLEKAYAAELLTARNHVASCLEQEILT